MRLLSELSLEGEESENKESLNNYLAKEPGLNTRYKSTVRKVLYYCYEAVGKSERLILQGKSRKN